MATLTGNELVKVLPISATGYPSSAEELVTVQAIANLGGGGGGTPGGTSGQLQANNTGVFAGVPNSAVNFTTGAIQQQTSVVGVATTAKTLALTDSNTIQNCNNASTQTITIPLNSSIAFPVNTIIIFEQRGAGQVIVVGSGGVTITNPNATNGTGSAIYALQETTDSWVIYGGVPPLSTLAATTSGSVVYSQPVQGFGYKVFAAELVTYVNSTTTSQTIAFPKAFTYTPVVTANSTTLTITATTTTLTITTTNSATAYNGLILVSGI